MQGETSHLVRRNKARKGRPGPQEWTGEVSRRTDRYRARKGLEAGVREPGFVGALEKKKKNFAWKMLGR